MARIKDALVLFNLVFDLVFVVFQRPVDVRSGVTDRVIEGYSFEDLGFARCNNNWVPGDLRLVADKIRQLFFVDVAVAVSRNAVAIDVQGDACFERGARRILRLGEERPNILVHAVAAVRHILGHFDGHAAVVMELCPIWILPGLAASRLRGPCESFRRAALHCFRIELPVFGGEDLYCFARVSNVVIGVSRPVRQEPGQLVFVGPLESDARNLRVLSVRNRGLCVRGDRSGHTDCSGAGDSQRSCHGCGEGRAKINLAGGEERPHVGPFLRRRLIGRISPGEPYLRHQTVLKNA